MAEVDPLLPKLSETIAFVFASLGSHTADRFSTELAPLGIRPRHFGMLRMLRDNNGQTQQQLSESIGVHRNVMVGLVDELEKRGLVERRKHPTDRRAHAVYLMPAGHEVLTRGAEIVKSLDAELLDMLAPAERTTLLTLLQRVSLGNGLRPDIHPGLTGDHMPPPC